MKILFLSYRFPYPPITGDRHRMIRNIKMLSGRHEITLITLYTSDRELDCYDEVKKYCERIITVKLPVFHSWLNLLRGLYRKDPFNVLYFYSKKMKQAVADLLQSCHFDIVYAGGIRIAECLLDTGKTAKIIDFGDCAALHFKRRIEHEGRLFSILCREELRRVIEYETMIYDRYRRGVVTSQQDKDAFPDNDRIDVVPTFYDFDEHEDIREDCEPNSIIFSGNVGYYSDKIAILFFFNEIFPLIQRRVPDSRLYIVGANPSPAVRRLADINSCVVVTGYVEDIQGYIKKACVSAAPMIAGAGILCKIIEPMSLGVPVVTTTVGNGGIQGKDGRDILIADEPRDFAEKVIYLFNNPIQRKRIVANGRELVRKRFSEKVVLHKMEKALKKTLEI